MTKFLRPNYFFFGILMGFVFCSVVGFILSYYAKFTNFNRFYPFIQPSLQYYPTSHELLNTARQNVSRDKILVLLGGNSIFRGVGQNPNELWSNELQRLLGDKFKVLNYAADAATITSFAGVAFRILSKEYPKIIFVSTSFPMSAGPYDGQEFYNYLFWDAYYKRLLQLSDSEKDKIKKMRKKQLKTSQGLEQHILSYLDSLFYFRNLWNWVGYNYLFTVWTTETRKKPFKARERYPEFVSNTFKVISQNYLTSPKDKEDSINYFKAYLALYIDDSQQPLKVNENAINNIIQGYAEAYSTIERSKIVCVINSANPLILALIPKKLQNMEAQIIKYASDQFKQLGYSVVNVGQNYSSQDYFDLYHLSERGGNNMAKQIAEKINTIATLYGYV